MKSDSAYNEALRYLDNAKNYLKQAGLDPDTKDYVDIKYVRTGSGTAYNGILLAVDEFLKQKEGSKYARPRSIEEYRTRLAKLDKKLLKLLNQAYDTLHIMGYYFGTTSRKTISSGMKDARKIIDYLE